MADCEPATSTVPAFAEVFAAYHGRVLGYARKLLGEADAEDVAQEVFLKISRRLGTLATAEKLTSWIYAITLNTVRDVARRRTATRDLHDEGSAADRGADAEDALAEAPDPGTRTPEEQAIHREMVACFLGYVRELPPAYYEVYALAELEQLGNEEIARRLGVSLATVKVRLHRARARLYNELRRHCRCYVDAHGELMGEPYER
jgi:RNA polymerase sigma-70 factor (ECF subfamily)